MKATAKKIFVTILVFLMFTIAMLWPNARLFAAERAVTTSSSEITVSATKNPYSDVTLKTVDKKTYKAIKWCKKHKVFQKVILGKKFHPNAKILRGEYLAMLKNTWGNKVKITITDLRKAGEPISEKYAHDKMIEVAKNCHLKIKWQGSKSVTMTKAKAARDIDTLAKFDSALKPRY